MRESRTRWIRAERPWRLLPATRHPRPRSGTLRWPPAGIRSVRDPRRPIGNGNRRPRPNPPSPTPIGDLWGTVRGYPTTPSAPKNGNSKRISRDKERVNPECRIRGGGGTPPIGQPGPSRDANFRPVPVLNCRCPQSRAIIESQATGVMLPKHAARAVSSAG